MASAPARRSPETTVRSDASMATRAADRRGQDPDWAPAGDNGGVTTVTEVVVVGSPEKPALRSYVAGRATVVEQAEPRGLGDAVLCAADAVGERPFVVALPDALVSAEVLRELLRRARDGAIALERVAPE